MRGYASRSRKSRASERFCSWPISTPDGAAMILVVCTDDDKLLAVARRQSNDDPAFFGKCYQCFPDTGPMPKAGEWGERVNTDAGWFSGSHTGHPGQGV